MNNEQNDKDLYNISEENDNKKEYKKGNKGIIALLLVVAIFFGYIAGVLYERTDASNGILEARKMERLKELIDENYYFSQDIDHKEAVENAYGAYVGSFNDPFTYYLSEETYSKFTESMIGNYVGIGVEITVTEENQIIVTNAFENSPAKKAGISAGDLILEVEGEPYSGDMLDDVVMVLKGKGNEEVKIKIYDLSEETEKEVSVIRDSVVAETVSHRMLENNIGYIKISSFASTTDEEFEKAYNTMNTENLNGLIIDLRNNGGGALDTVVKISDILMPKGTIVRIKYKNTEDEVYYSDEKCFDKKIAVLVNENTASASELLAGGLKDNNNAVLIGKNTFGKGVVGTVFPVDSKSATVITTGEYFLPKGNNIHNVGIKPDCEVDLPETVKNIFLMTDEEDTQLKRAIEELK